MIPVTTSKQALRDQVETLALRFGLRACLLEEITGGTFLLLTPLRLELHLQGVGASGPVYVDFTSGSFQRRLRGFQRTSNPTPTLARAVGVTRGGVRTVLDVTAGLARDAFLLASLGCQVHLVERSPVVSALLEDALRRAAEDESAAEVIERMQLTFGEASSVISHLDTRPDVIYFDPMYPPTRKSARKNKAMHAFRTVVGNDGDAASLLSPARAAASFRVVVKRARRAPYLAGVEPSGILRGKTTRFDLYAPITPGENLGNTPPTLFRTFP
jgi:16S rRNA (guanine1516-N2)-methyltransferase